MQANTYAAAYEGGFESPVFGAQAVFRSVMDAMARPGTIVDLAQPVSAPAPLETAAAADATAQHDHADFRAAHRQGLRHGGGERLIGLRQRPGRGGQQSVEHAFSIRDGCLHGNNLYLSSCLYI